MKRVIIADDSETARMFVRRCMEIAGLSGVEFLEASNGAEALEILECWGGDLIVSDLYMPKMDGVELIRRIRAQDKYNKLPILVVTSARTPAKEAELIGLGANAVLGKPVSPAALAPVLKELV